MSLIEGNTICQYDSMTAAVCAQAVHTYGRCFFRIARSFTTRMKYQYVLLVCIGIAYYVYCCCFLGLSVPCI